MSSTVAQRPGRLDLELVKGDDAELELTFVDTAGVAVDLSGRAWSLRITGPGLYVDLDSAVVTDDADDGVLGVPFAAATTAAIGRDVTWALSDTTNKRTLLDGEIRAYVAGHAGAGSSSIEQTVTITNSTAAVTVTAAVVGPPGSGGGGGGGASTLDGLSDVDTTTDPPTTGDVLSFDGTAWTPATLDDSLIEIAASQVVSGQLNVARVASGTATDGHVPTVSSGALVLAAPSGGSSGQAILGRVSYDPGSLATYSIASGTQADVDATNLILSDFTVPASGIVEVRFEGLCVSGTGSTMHWGVRNGSGDVGSDVRVTATNTGIRASVHLRITGLTPGATISGWRWGWRRPTGSGTGNLFAGGGVGPAVMEVRSA